MEAPGEELAPKQARSQRTLNRLLDAAEALFLERPPHEVSVADIVRRAKSSVGGFYARFADKDALLRALQRRRITIVRDQIAAIADPERWRALPLELIVRGLLDELLISYVERRRLIAAFVGAAAANPVGWADTVRERDALVEVVLGVLLPAHAASIAHPDPERAIRFATRAAFAIADSYAIRAGLVGSAFDDAQELRDEMHRMYMGYLQRA